MKYIIIISFAFMIHPYYGQKQIEGTNATQEHTVIDGDTVNFLHFSSDYKVAKPTLLFLQGSLPIPLIIEFGDYKHINTPFKRDSLLNDYNLVIISMPHTPVLVKNSAVNASYSYITDAVNKDSYDINYLKNNVLANYVKRTKAVVDHLVTKKWVESSQIHVIGHSQGAKVATKTAAKFPEIFKSVSLLGFNPDGRFDQLIRQERKNMQHGIITSTQYQENIEQLYIQLQKTNKTPLDYEQGHSSLLSFSIDYKPLLKKLTPPVFIGFGTNDIIAENCDLLPILFINQGKKNYLLKPYLELNHNFFESLPNGKPNYEHGGHWDDVIQDITHWISSLD